MEEIKFDLIERVCKKQNFDELLLEIVKSNKGNRINKFLQTIEDNENIDKKLKREIYEEIFDYVDDVNKYLKLNLEKIFSIAAKETIIQINNELNGGNIEMRKKIKVIIAEELNPEIIITDLMRNHKYTGLDIIRKYTNGK